MFNLYPVLVWGDVTFYYLIKHNISKRTFVRYCTSIEQESKKKFKHLENKSKQTKTLVLYRVILLYGQEKCVKLDSNGLAQNHKEHGFLNFVYFWNYQLILLEIKFKDQGKTLTCQSESSFRIYIPKPFKLEHSFFLRQQKSVT